MHDLDGVSQFALDELDLAAADAMLARACALELDCAFDQTAVKGARPILFSMIVGIDQNKQMEIAIAHMTHDGRDQFAPLQIVGGQHEALGEPRYWNADVGHYSARPRSEA